MHKICVLTATRAEYGLLRWLMQDIRDDPGLLLQVVVTGAHLVPRFGNTWRQLVEDGFEIDAKVEMLDPSDASPAALVRSTGECSLGLADVFARLAPDMLVILGDRYELMPAATAALLMDIPIAHISGGDVTEGAIDDSIRHALTKLAALHLVSSKEAVKRVLQMGEEPERVFWCGGPGLDNLRRLPSIPRKELALDLGLDAGKDWALLTYHPETRLSVFENLETLQNILTALGKQAEERGIQVLATYANADLGGCEINSALENAAKGLSWLKVCPNLGQLRYVSMLRQVKFMLGNSSSAIFETPTLGLPAVNIGDRQKGRQITSNIILSGRGLADISAAIAQACAAEGGQPAASPYGDGHFAEKALSAIKTTLSWDRQRLLTKRFVDLP